MYGNELSNMCLGHLLVLSTSTSFWDTTHVSVLYSAQTAKKLVEFFYAQQ